MANQKSRLAKLRQKANESYDKLKQRVQSYLKRRPHRSFRRTRRRDLPKRANLPSNIVFTSYVIGFITKNKRMFLTVAVLYLISYTLIAGIASQDSYRDLVDIVGEIGPSVVGGEISKASETFILFSTTLLGGIGTSLNDVQKTYVGFLYIILWLSVVWLARHRFNAVKVKVRDALYNAGSPILPTVLVALLGVVQLLPAAIAILTYAALQTGGIINGGAPAMLLGVGAFLAVVLSAYWLVSTFIALIVVTVPGTYPMQAIKMAGDIVIGRRTQVLLRLLWMALCVLALWVVILIPIILIADVLPWDWLPLIPVTIQFLGAASFIFSSVYIYILYRGMIDESLTPDKQ